MKGIILSTDNTIEVKDFGEPLYKTVGEAVGGYIEIVYPALLEKPYLMIVNEEGLLQGLPLNTTGSFLYRTQIHGQPIVGNAVIMKNGYVNGEPDIIGLSDNEIIDLINLFKTNFTFLKENNHD